MLNLQGVVHLNFEVGVAHHVEYVNLCKNVSGSLPRFVSGL